MEVGTLVRRISREGGGCGTMPVWSIGTVCRSYQENGKTWYEVEPIGNPGNSVYLFSERLQVVPLPGAPKAPSEGTAPKQFQPANAMATFKPEHCATCGDDLVNLKIGMSAVVLMRDMARPAEALVREDVQQLCPHCTTDLLKHMQYRRVYPIAGDLHGQTAKKHRE